MSPRVSRHISGVTKLAPNCEGGAPVPVLISRTSGMVRGDGDGNRVKQTEEYFEWYDNKNKTYTKKKIIIAKTIWSNKEETITTKTNIETIKDNEYFKRKLNGTI